MVCIFSVKKNKTIHFGTYFHLLFNRKNTNSLCFHEICILFPFWYLWALFVIFEGLRGTLTRKNDPWRPPGGPWAPDARRVGLLLQKCECAGGVLFKYFGCEARILFKHSGLLFNHVGCKARLLIKHYGCEARLLFKRGVAKQDFCSKNWVRSKIFVQTSWMRSKTFVQKIWIRSNFFVTTF